MVIRLLEHREGSGAWHMAADQALLDAVDREPSAAVFRTYIWSEPTLSLGYFQPIAEARADRRWEGMPIVRRPSGGGALWHERELTYAVVVPRTHVLARHPSDLYRALHEAVAAWLRDQGWPAMRRSTITGSPARESASSAGRPFLCFLDRDPEDVVVAGTKIVGSAQRRRPRAVLQHGSILRARSAVTPEIPGLADLGVGASFERIEAWARTLPRVFAAALDLPMVPAEWSDGLLNAIDDAMSHQFTHPSWTMKR
jgi:lipoate-protein ligase A